MNEKWFLSELGKRIRRHRERRGFSLSELAERSELSRRYMTETEAGRANPSIIKLAGISRALRIGLADLCDLPLEDRRGRRIALVGMDQDFHGKIGRKLALALERPLVELERRLIDKVESPHGFPSPQVTGERLRQLEAQVLEDYLIRDGDSIMVTGALLFHRRQTWERLLSSCFTVWVKVDIDRHWEGIMVKQPTSGRRGAPTTKAKLREMMAARETFYAKSHLTVEATDYDEDFVAQQIMSAAL